jgi:hypothetical protein
MKNAFLAIVITCSFITTFAQSSDNNTLQRPKLVVGIVVDQMRWDYLYKFYPLFSGTGGFKRLLNAGFSCDNTFVPYTPTVTAAGHTSVYTALFRLSMVLLEITGLISRKTNRFIVQMMIRQKQLARQTMPAK